MSNTPRSSLSKYLGEKEQTLLSAYIKSLLTAIITFPQQTFITSKKSIKLLALALLILVFIQSASFPLSPAPLSSDMGNSETREDVLKTADTLSSDKITPGSSTLINTLDELSLQPDKQATSVSITKIEEFTAVPAVDLGATNIRIAFILRKTSDGTFYPSDKKLVVWQTPSVKMTELRSSGDFAENLTEHIISTVRKGSAYLSSKGIRSIQHIGIGAPGAYLDSGEMYPGTADNTEGLEAMHLRESLQNKLGKEWKVSVNNDGIVQVLTSVRMLLSSDLKDKIPVKGPGKNKIVGFVPGTGFGAGGIIIDENGQPFPMTGPQQFYDIQVKSDWKDGKPVIVDDFCGKGFDEKARAMGLSSAKDLIPILENINDPNHEKVKGLYHTAALAYAETIKSAHLGKGIKTDVINPPEVLDGFWDNVRGTEIFMLGGLITSHPDIKSIVFDTIKKELQNSGFTNIELIAQDEIPGLNNLGKEVGLLGGALLVPSEDLHAPEETDLLLEYILSEVRRILDRSDQAVLLKNLFINSISNHSSGAKIIPVIYKRLEEELSAEKLERISEITFELFTGMSIAQFADTTTSRDSLPGDSKKTAREGNKPFICTLTPNIALDFSADAGNLLDNERSGFSMEAGGKGINMSVGLKQWGIESIALGYANGITGEIFRSLMEKNGLSSENLIIGENGNTRINLSIHAGGKDQVHLTMQGPRVGQKEQDQAEQFMLGELKQGDILIMAGSLPRGVSSDYYGDLIGKLSKNGVKTYVDTRNMALRGAIKAKPSLLGVNLKEIAEVLQIDPEPLKKDPSKIAPYVKKLVVEGIEIVVISMGSKGMVMGTKEGVFWAHPPKVEKISDVGAGDTIKVAFAYAEHEGLKPLDALKLAAAASAITVTKSGTGISGIQEALAKRGEVLIDDITSSATVQDEKINIWETINLFHNTRIEIILSQSLKIDEDLEKAIRDIKKKHGNIDVVRCKKEDLLNILSEENKGIKRIIMSDEEMSLHINSLMQNDTMVGSFRDVRLLNVRLPEKYSTKHYKTAYCTKMLTIAILARLLEKGENETPKVEFLLKELLTNSLDIDLNSFIDTLGRPEERITELSKIRERLSYFLNIKNAIKLITILEKELRIMKEFWTYA